MKIKTILLFTLFALAAFGQQNFAAGGISYNPGATPAIAGTGLYAHTINDSGTYAFTVIDALPAAIKPFTVSTSIGAGIAQRLPNFGKVNVYIPTSAGISWTGKNTGWQWTTGALAAIHVKGSWIVAPAVRLLKNSVSGDGYRVMVSGFIGRVW